MSWRRSVRAARHQVVRHLPASARALGHRALSVRSSSRRTGSAPTLTVVVPVYNVEQYLDECLTSLRSQTLQSMQIVVVDDGSTDGSTAIYERHTAQDSRIVVLKQANAGLGAARNSGIRLATGRYLTFLDSDDTLPPTAYATMVRTLDASGSDFCIGSLRRVTRGRGASTTWIDTVHARDRIAITIDDFPAAVMDVICCNRMVRRSFWESAGLSFPEGVAYEDHVPMMTAFLRATSFDILRAVTYFWRIREDQTSIGQQKKSLQNLKDRLHAKEVAGRIVLEHASVAVRDAWLARVLDLDLWGFISQVEGADEEYWRELSGASRTYLDLAGPEVLATVRVDRRVRTWLTAYDERDRVVEFIQAQRHEGVQLRTTVADGVVVAQLPFLDDERVGLPRSLYEVSPRQSSLVTSLRGVSTDNDGWDLEVWAFARYVDLAERRPILTSWLEHQGDGERIELAVERAPTPEVTQWSGSRYQTYDRASVRVHVDARELVRRLPDGADGTVGTWQLVVRFEVEGVVREGAVTHRDRTGSAGHLASVPVGDLTVSPLMEDGERLAFRCRRPIVVLRDLVVDGRRLRGSVELPSRAGLDQLVATSSAGVKVSTALRFDATGGRFDLQLPEAVWTDEPSDRRFWRLDTAGSTTRPVRLAWPRGERGEWMERWDAEAPVPPELVVGRTERGNVQVREVQHYPVVDDVELGDDEVVVRGRWLGRAPACWSPVLSSPRTRVGPSRLTSAGRSFEIAFPLVASAWGADPMPLPPGDYALRLEGAKPATAPPRMALDLITRSPLRRRGSHLRLELRRGDQNRVMLRVSAPLADDEVGKRSQQALQQWYREHDHAELPKAVLFQCHRGEAATDSQLAIHHELRRRDLDLELYWGVSDLSVRLPEGGIALLTHSREWYRVLAGAKLLCTNVDFDRYFDKKPHQTLLQTFHGYPFETMGVSLWARQGGRTHVAHEVVRRRSAWDILLTPSPEMNRYYREEYRYEGLTLDRGYPRTDALVGSVAERTRRDTRRRLGIADHQVAVLCAPTSRDRQDQLAGSAEVTHHLDEQRTSGELGDDYVLLVRGHRDRARTGTGTPDTAQVLDVTDYPEINDLVLASDAAVLDYSSLRFDYAITTKPMLFLVPDLEEYVGAGRGGLFPFEGTAPGPWLRTTDEVIGALRDLDAVRAAHLEEYELFNRTYNRYHDGRASRRVVDALLARAQA